MRILQGFSAFFAVILVVVNSQDPVRGKSNAVFYYEKDAIFLPSGEN